MSRQRKRDAVLRLLRGEDLELVSRALGVTAAPLSGWRDAFLAGARRAWQPRANASRFAEPTDGEVLENERLKTKLGEMLLKRELLEAKVAALEAGRYSRMSQKVNERPLQSTGTASRNGRSGRTAAAIGFGRNRTPRLGWAKVESDHSLMARAISWRRPGPYLHRSRNCSTDDQRRLGLCDTQAADLSRWLGK